MFCQHFYEKFLVFCGSCFRLAEGLQLEERRAEDAREHGRAENADFREVELRAFRKGQRRDKDGHREADAAEHARRGELALRGTARQRQLERPAEQERRAENAERLAKAETRENAEENRRARVKRREGNRDARIRQGENRHDAVGRPRLQRMLELVEKRCFRLRGRRNRKAEKHARNRRMNARLQEGIPSNETEHDIKRHKAHAQTAEQERRSDGQKSHEQGAEDEVGIVEQRDDDDSAEVIDDGERRQKDDEPQGSLPGRDGHDAERKSDIRGHRDAPAAKRRQADVDGRIEKGRHNHAAERRADGQQHRRGRAQLAVKELALDFEADDKEEHGHEAIINPVQQAHRHRVLPCSDGNRQVQDMLVRPRERRIGHDERENRAAEQDDTAARLPAQKRKERLGHSLQ